MRRQRSGLHVEEIPVQQVARQISTAPPDCNSQPEHKRAGQLTNMYVLDGLQILRQVAEVQRVPLVYTLTRTKLWPCQNVCRSMPGSSARSKTFTLATYPPIEENDV